LTIHYLDLPIRRKKASANRYSLATINYTPMSGNYQSRVFTFINKRTDRLKDTCAKGLRHIKVAVIWTGQVLLYPLQLLAQQIGSFQPQLAPPPPQRSLPHPASDINIEQALELVVSSGYPIEVASSDAVKVEQRSASELRARHPTTAGITVTDDEDRTPEEWEWEIAYTPERSRQATRTKPIVRGLSSLLIDRQLVLVTTENELIDILTLAQQQEIRRRIGMDLAIDWYQWHHHNLSTDRTDKQLVKADEFLILEGNTIEGFSIVDRDLSQLASADRDRRSPKLSERLQNWWQNLTVKPSTSTSDRSAKVENIESDSAPQLAPSSYSFMPQPPHRSRLLDLPQLPPFIEDTSNPKHDLPVLETIAKLQPDWLKQWWSYYREYLYIPTSSELEIVEQPVEFQLTPVVRQSDLKIKAARKTKFRSTPKHQNLLVGGASGNENRGAGKLSSQSSKNIEYQPDWIEITSETIGYKISLLARLLAWLDLIVLKIENWLIKIWQLIADRTVKD
jgi:hypothetical protein